MAHPYVGEACAHNVHEECLGECRFCEEPTPCVCGCHRAARVAAAATDGPLPPRRMPRATPVPTGARGASADR